MSGQYVVEGHRQKTSVQDDDTLTFDGRVYDTVEEATAKAKEFFEHEQDLSLAVIYRKDPDGTPQGVKFIYKDEDGTFEDFPLYWNSCDRCCED